MSTRFRAKIRTANRLNSSQLLSLVAQELTQRPANFELGLYHANELPTDLQDKLFQLVERNMYEIYESSESRWDSAEKKSELFDADSRFIIARDRNEMDTVVAYCMFRFDVEDEAPVAYCYELQIAAGTQRQGLGKYMMNLLKSIAAQTGMHKVMLTVQKANPGAIQFYHSIGFAVDPFSLDYDDGSGDVEITDYSILSISVA